MSATGALLLAGGILVGVLAILTLVFWIIYRVGLRARERIAADGDVIQRSGTRWIRVVLRHYRGPTWRASYRNGNNIGELLLTSRGLFAVGSRLPSFAPEDLSRCAAWLDGQTLHLATSQPPQAQGDLEIRVRVDDGPAWLDALRRLGVRIGEGGPPPADLTAPERARPG